MKTLKERSIRSSYDWVLETLVFITSFVVTAVALAPLV
jgi:hypothetical protein